MVCNAVPLVPQHDITSYSKARKATAVLSPCAVLLIKNAQKPLEYQRFLICFWSWYYWYYKSSITVLYFTCYHEKDVAFRIE